MHKRTLQFLYAILGLTVFLLVSIGGFAFRSLSNLIEEGDSMAQTSQVLYRAERVVSTIREAEAGVRGYMITKDPSFLAPYYESAQQLSQQMAMLDSIINVSSKPLQRERFSRLSDFIIQRNAIMGQALQVYHDPQSSDKDQRLIIRLQRGKASMDSIRMLIDSIENTERLELTERMHQRNLLSGDTIGLLTLISLMAIVLFSMAFYFVIQEMVRRFHYQRQLEQSINSLSRTNQELEQFTYVTSHHLQEPLRKLQTFGNRLMQKHGASVGDDARFVIQRMNELAHFMQSLLEDLLMYTGLGLKANSANFDELELSTVIQKVMDNHEKQIKGSMATVQWEKKTWKIWGSEEQLVLLFSQILQNSLKFVAKNQNPTISISTLATQGDQMAFTKPEQAFKPFVKIVFSDNGIGIDMKYRDAVFKLFQRLHHAKDYPGTGVGLAICKQIILCHNGYIELAEAEKGCTFHIYLPL